MATLPIDTEIAETIVNLGPQHPAAHGVINMRLQLRGEIIETVTPNVGFLHRGLEKIAEMTTYPTYMPYTDRVDYLAAMFANQGYAMAVERLASLEVPRRAEYLRVLASELNRIASHLIAVGVIAMDLGAFTPFLHALREREKLNDLIEALCGARLTYNYVRLGGISRDLKPDLAQQIHEFCERFDVLLDEFDQLISYNEILVQRMIDVATISEEDAIAYGLAGPNLRASGVDWDLRRHRPYSIYPELDFEVCLGKGVRGTIGDAYDRYIVRIEEMRESSRMVRQILEGLPEGEIQTKLPKKLRPAKGEVYSQVESARGEMGFHLISDGTDKPYRLKIRCGSFTALQIVGHVSPGLMLADLVVLFSSLDIVAPEIDR